MILDKLENLGEYRKLNLDVIVEVEKFIAGVTEKSEIGKTFIREKQLYAMIQEYAPRTPAESIVEEHRDYLDIHIPLRGREIACYAPVDGLKLQKDYRPESDDLVYPLDMEQVSQLALPVGSFCIFFPGEGHVPGLRGEANYEKFRKIVVKIHKDLWNGK